MLTLIGPFRQLLPLTNLPEKGSIRDEQLEVIEEGGILIKDAKVLQVGLFSELRATHPAANVEEITEDMVALPGFVDAHTHICYGGSRAMEKIAAEGNGVVVLIGQDVSAEQQLAEVLQFPEPPSVTGPGSPAGIQNYRVIGTGSQILKRLGIGKMRLMSAPVHFNALSGFNLEVTDFIQP